MKAKTAKTFKKTREKKKTYKKIKTGPIAKEMLIHEVIVKHPETHGVFVKYGVGCIGCMFAENETLEQGISAHGIDVDKFVKELNEVVSCRNQ